MLFKYDFVKVPCCRFPINVMDFRATGPAEYCIPKEGLENASYKQWVVVLRYSIALLKNSGLSEDENFSSSTCEMITPLVHLAIEALSPAT